MKSDRQKQMVYRMLERRTTAVLKDLGALEDVSKHISVYDQADIDKIALALSDKLTRTLETLRTGQATFTLEN